MKTLKCSGSKRVQPGSLPKPFRRPRSEAEQQAIERMCDVHQELRTASWHAARNRRIG